MLSDYACAVWLFCDTALPMVDVRALTAFISEHADFVKMMQELTPRGLEHLYTCVTAIIWLEPCTSPLLASQICWEAVTGWKEGSS